MVQGLRGGYGTGTSACVLFHASCGVRLFALQQVAVGVVDAQLASLVMVQSRCSTGWHGGFV